MTLLGYIPLIHKNSKKKICGALRSRTETAHFGSTDAVNTENEKEAQITIEEDEDQNLAIQNSPFTGKPTLVNDSTLSTS